MDIQKIKAFCHSKIGYVVLSLLAALLIVVIVAALAVGWLKSYTHHGEEVAVPDLTGLYVEEAQILAKDSGLIIKVIDSTYTKQVPLGAIIEQNPKAESKAKEGRVVYVIINAKSVRMIPVPDLRDMSFRQAEATLTALGFTVGEPRYEPSVYKDLVLDVVSGNGSIAPGTRLSEGSKITLVVGFGSGTEQVRIPDVIGLSLSTARSALLNQRLIIGSTDYDEPMTEQNADKFVVYDQDPHAGGEILEGSPINLKMTTNLEKAASAANTNEEEEFF